MVQLTIRSTVTLNNGVNMPLFGLGTYQTLVGDIKNSLITALNGGYISIDTASVYRNEEAIGDCLKELFESGKFKREDLFITTKAGPAEHGYDNALAACENSLKRLKLDYLDLYLIHWPGTSGRQPTDPLNRETRLETWRAFEKLYADKKCRSIGVSNYTVEHLEDLLKNSSVVPAVNQVEFHPFLYQKELHDYCTKNNIVLEAYSSLVRADKDSFEDNVIVEIATKYKKTPAQVLLRWAIQKSIVVIPKSTKSERIIENANIFDFDINDADMLKLDSLHKDKRICWNPHTIA
ncbi:aldo-keto reductase [Heterostelium album PN500]|uniref:Aldo-keto reductase n=1 Tax=Heterostelium pallidum (strain ATCC 26659 / Pp 5 / PN500) TaxID=670386 RepID=D3BR73_HETP5|nr:aldo-keto reductase [Heterostelium album PN500]EFA75905.1 aldo-keto reductase [Heterostelium album PN500]|eukprot:XP_020428039.1 aldo-keto reductase [Heterostelium album PN500]